MKNKEGKKESNKRGVIGSEKREGEMTNKVEKEKPRKNVQKLASLAFGFFFMVFPFHFIGHLFVLFSDSVVPLLLDSSFPSLFFI